MSATRVLHRGGPPPLTSEVERVSASIREVPVVCKADLTRDDLTGFVLGQYELGRKIGSGGMGCVFAARHTRLDRAVAIKFIATDVAALPEALERFDQETLALGHLQHPNIVHAIDAGSLHGLKYLVTEYLDGTELGALIEQRGPLPISEACDLIRQAAVGLAHSHEQGFLHRDIKPNNLLLDSSGVLKILDFGLVRDAVHGSHPTVSGEMLGTFDFVAPEQAHDASTADARSDIYSLGCTLIFLLSGRPPFDSARYATAAAKLKGHLFDQPEWLTAHSADIPKELIAVITRMVAKSPSERIASALDVIRELRPWTKSGEGFSEGSTAPRLRMVCPTRLNLKTLAMSVGILAALFLVIIFAVRRPMASEFANTTGSDSSLDAFVREQRYDPTEPVQEDLLAEAEPPSLVPVSAPSAITNDSGITVSEALPVRETEVPDLNRILQALDSVP